VAIIADEPTGNLDPETSIEILNYLKKINAKGISVIIGTHDYDLVRHSPSRTLMIKDMNLVESTIEPAPAGTCWRPVPKEAAKAS